MLSIKNKDDFHWYAGRTLNLTNSEIENNLHKMIGTRTDLFSHYNSLKLKSDLCTRRIFLVDILKMYISDFLGTEYCENDDGKKIDCQSNLIELESLEKYLANAVLPDSNFDIWRDCIVELGLKTPTENVDLEAEFDRLDLPKIWTNDINISTIKHYSPDRRLRNLALSALSNAETDEECATAELLNLEYISRYYDLMGITISLKKYQKGKVGSLVFNDGYHGGEELPFLPKLPCNIEYSKEFYCYINNRLRSEHNLFRLEWELCKIVRFGHHSIMVEDMDKTTNDLLFKTSGINDLILLTKQNDLEQNKVMMLLLGDFGKCYFSKFLSDSHCSSDNTKSFLRKWYDHDSQFVINAIQRSTKNNKLNSRCMSREIKKRFSGHGGSLRYKHIKDTNPLSCF